MAFFLEGKTECQICGQLIETSHELKMFPAFLGACHPLHWYSDGVFHRNCFEASPDRDEVERLFTRFRYICDHRPPNMTMEEVEAWGRDAFAEFH
jgi:hypothetical protein